SMPKRYVSAALSVCAAVLLLCAATRPASALVTFYTTQATFTAASSTTLESVFEGFAGGALASPLVEGRCTYSSSINATPFYVLKPGTPGDVCCTFPHVTSAMLSGNGNEDFDITFSGPVVSAVGFNVTTNNTSVKVDYYDAANALAGTITLLTHNVATY